MKVLVTGATGLVGRAVVEKACKAGHDVLAVVRPASRGAFATPLSGRVQEVEFDLRAQFGIEDAVDSVDAVIHAAAAKGGDLPSQFAVTVRGTEKVLAAMARRPGRRLVAVSSMSVYDLAAVPSGTLVQAGSTPLDVDGPHRDAYARAKLYQERLTTAAHRDGIADVVTVRPGIVLGALDELWHPLLGTWAGSRFYVVGRNRRAPIVLVDNVAEAIVAALTTDGGGEVVDVVDDDLPTNEEYVEEVVARTEWRRPVFIPWHVVNATTSLGSAAARRLLGPKAALPGLLVPARVHARFKPLRFTNEAARTVLHWQPQLQLGAALDRVTRIAGSIRSVDA